MMKHISVLECIMQCDEMSNCQNVVYVKGGSMKTCYLNDKVLTGSEPVSEGWFAAHSLYKSCSKGIMQTWHKVK